MQVRLFGRLADYAGRQLELAVADGQCRLADVLAMLAHRHPALGDALGGAGVRACIGPDFLGPEDRVASNATVEFWPPVSGG